MKVHHTVISKRYFPTLIVASLSTISIYILMLTDSIIAGNVIDVYAVAAITLVSPMISFIIFVCYVLSSGAMLTASFHRGKADDEEANNIFVHGMLLCLVAGIVLSTIMIVFKSEILSIWHISKNTAEYANGYYSGIVMLPIFMAINLMFYNMIIEKGREKICFIVGISEAAVKIILSLCLVSSTGVIGLSLSSTISMAAGTLVFLIYYIISIRKTEHKFKWKGIKPGSFKDILVVGFNDSMDGFLMTILPWTISLYLIFSFGDDRIILFTVIINAVNLIGSFLAGHAHTMELLICLYYGENNLHGVRKIMKLSKRTVLIVSLIIVVCFMIFADFIPLLYGITSPAERLEAARALRIFTVYLPFYCIEYTYFEYYGCVGHAAYSMTFLALLIYVLPVALMIIGGQTIGIYGAWCGMGMGYVAAFLVDHLACMIIGKRNGAQLKGKLLLKKSDLDRQFSYDIDGTADQVIEAVEKMDKDLSGMNIPEAVGLKIQLFMEELGMQAVGRQKEGSFQIEYTVMLDKEPTLIFRDNGILVDEVREAEELNSVSLRSYILAQLACSADNCYRPAGERNRTIFHIETNTDGESM